MIIREVVCFGNKGYNLFLYNPLQQPRFLLYKVCVCVCIPFEGFIFILYDFFQVTTSQESHSTVKAEST